MVRPKATVSIETRPRATVYIGFIARPVTFSPDSAVVMASAEAPILSAGFQILSPDSAGAIAQADAPSLIPGTAPLTVDSAVALAAIDGAMFEPGTATLSPDSGVSSAGADDPVLSGTGAVVMSPDSAAAIGGADDPVVSSNLIFAPDSAVSLAGSDGATLTGTGSVEFTPESAVSTAASDTQAFSAVGAATMSPDSAIAVGSVDDPIVTGSGSAMMEPDPAVATGAADDAVMSNVPAPGPIRIEAENMTLIDYVIESGAFASNGQYIGLLGPTNVDGTATTTFSGATGNYRIDVAYFDEADGESTFIFRVDGLQIDTWVGNTSPGGNQPSAVNLTVRTVSADVTLTDGVTVLELEGFKESGENARVDYIELTPVVSNIIFATDGLTLTATWDVPGQAYTTLVDAVAASAKVACFLSPTSSGVIMESGAAGRGLMLYAYQGTLYFRCGNGAGDAETGEGTGTGHASWPIQGTQNRVIEWSANSGPGDAVLYVDGQLVASDSDWSTASLGGADAGTAGQVESACCLNLGGWASEGEGVYSDTIESVEIFAGQTTADVA